MICFRFALQCELILGFLLWDYTVSIIVEVLVVLFSLRVIKMQKLESLGKIASLSNTLISLV